MVTQVTDEVAKVIALLRGSKVIPEHVLRRYEAICVREGVTSYKSWEATRESQVAHYDVRVDLDAKMREDGTKPTMVGFEGVLSGLRKSDTESVRFHLLAMQGATLLICTDVGTTRAIGVLWSFEDGVDPFP